LRQLLTERYRERLAGVLCCYDRIIVTGTLPGACYARGMTGFLSARNIRIFDYPRFAEPLRDRVRNRAAELASAAGVTIEHIAKNHIRKEDLVAEVLAVRGDHPGLVHTFHRGHGSKMPPFRSGSCLGHHRLHPPHEIGVAQDAWRLEEVLHLKHLPMDSGILCRKPRERATKLQSGVQIPRA
jgi:hypothetical protein